MWRLLLLGTAACWSASTPAPRTLSNDVAVPVGRMPVMELGRDSFGPITGMTPATEDGLRAALGSTYRVRTVNRRGPELHTFLGTELLFYVIPNDDDSLFNIHAVSPKITILEHPDWVIGAAFTGADALTSCECWGEHPMCFGHGDHVAVGFDVDCGNLATQAERRKLLGVPIQRAVWSPHPYGGIADPSAPPVVSPRPPSLKEIFGGDP